MIPSPTRLVSVLLVVLGLAAGAWGQTGPPGNTDRILHGTTYQQRLALMWITIFEGETLIQGKMFRPMAMHRVTATVGGRKIPGASKKQTKMMETGSSA